MSVAERGKMKTVADVLNGCLELAYPLEPLEPMLTEAVGCVLAHDVHAPFDRPLVRVAACDGYAVKAQDFQQASRTKPQFGRVLGTIHTDATVNGYHATPTTKTGLFGRKAETPKPVTDMRMLPELLGTDMYRVSAGAPLPDSADAVIDMAATDMGTQQVRVSAGVQRGDNIVDPGADVNANDVILRAGTVINARQVALLAGVGLLRVMVHPRPRVVIISVGDELIDPTNVSGEWDKQRRRVTPTVGRVFDSNGHALTVAISDLGGETYRTHPVPDDATQLREVLMRERVRADAIIITGALSPGSAHTVRDVLTDIGQMRFDEVAMSPVDHVGYGTFDHIPTFCLPADPVAALIGFEIFVRPVLLAMAGHSDLYRRSIKAHVDRGWSSPQGKRDFARVVLSTTQSGKSVATVLGDPAFTSLSLLAQSNALAVVPENVTQVRAGDQLYCMSLD